MGQRKQAMLLGKTTYGPTVPCKRFGHLAIRETLSGHCTVCKESYQYWRDWRARNRERYRFYQREYQRAYYHTHRKHLLIGQADRRRRKRASLNTP